MSVSVDVLGQTSSDADKDGIPDIEDVCPDLAGTKANKGCPEEKKAFSEADKKLLVKNFLIILNNVKTGFKSIKTGETDWDVVTRHGQSRSGIRLFPNYTDPQTRTLLFAQYNGKPMNSYEEPSPVDITTIVSALLPTLKAKGFMEVNTKGMNEGMEGRSFRSKEAVLQIASNTNNGQVTIDIGKFPYYYEKDVVAVGTKPPVKTVSTAKKPPENKIAVTGVFIEKKDFDELMETVCENRMHQKLTGKIKPDNNKWYETTSALNGVAKNMPVYYLQTSTLRFAVKTGLSDNMGDLDNAAAYINSLLEKTDACWEAYRKLKLAKDEQKQYYADVYAWDDGGIFIYVEKENGKVQLRVEKINYAEDEKKKTNPVPVANKCGDMETILKDCIAGFKNAKGSFVRKSTPNEYFTTTLPALGLKNKYVVESVSLDVVDDNIIRKQYNFFTADESYENSTDGIKMYEKLKADVRNCVSGTANVSDETNQKIYELFTNYNGYRIRIAVIYTNFFGSNVSISFRVQD